MNATGRSLRTICIGAALAMALLFCVQGCKKEEPTVNQPAQPQIQQLGAAAQEAAATVTEQVAAATAQTVCPIMDSPINKDIFVEYEGKRVYFCCKGCEEKFLAAPAKYVAELPQFQE